MSFIIGKIPPGGQVPEDRECCSNCRHMQWMVGIGCGVKCGHPANRVSRVPMAIPSRYHWCEHFEAKDPGKQADLDKN